MYEISRISELFPFKSFRSHQREVIEDIVNSFNGEVEVFLLNGPVGFGKSPVGICVSRMTDEKKFVSDEHGSIIEMPEQVYGAYYTTPQKFLQDQLANDFDEYINLIKGRDSYSCLTLPGSTCKYGKCQTSKFMCKEACPYLFARNEAIRGQICCTNFSYLMIVSKFLFGERQLLIVDECHSIPEWVLNWVTCTIRSNDVSEKIPEHKTFEDYLSWLTSVSEKLQVQLELLKPKKEGSQEFVFGLKEKKDKLSELITKINRLLDDYKNNKEEWVFTLLDKGTNKERIQFQPVTAGRFMDSMIWWRGHKKLLMSGTIFPELFVEEAGLIDKVCQYVEIPSTFPKENRPIFYWPAGKMSRDYKDFTMPKMIQKIAVIMSKNPKNKGIVHCNSYDIADRIYEGLKNMTDMLPEGGVWLQDRGSRNESLQGWIDNKKPSLFLSVNFVEGVDLKDDLCRYQILAKVQYPYLGDKRVKARMNMARYKCDKCNKYYRTSRDLVSQLCNCGGKLSIDMKIDIYICPICGTRLISPHELLSCKCGGIFSKKTVIVDGALWYDMQAIIDIVQSYGRAVRSETDTAEYWILDESFMSLYKKRNIHFPKFFKEAVSVIK
jgi:Rad3-related DNA helicase